MKNVLNIIKQIIKANWIALIGIVIMSIMLAVGCNFNFLLGLILLTVAYFVLGFGIEYVMDLIRKERRKKLGKTEEQIKKEDAIRAARRERGKALLKNNEMSTRNGFAHEEKNQSSVVPSGERREIVRRASRLKFEEPTMDEMEENASKNDNSVISDISDEKKERKIRVVCDTEKYKRASGGIKFEETNVYTDCTDDSSIVDEFSSDEIVDNEEDSVNDIDIDDSDNAISVPTDSVDLSEYEKDEINNQNSEIINDSPIYNNEFDVDDTIIDSEDNSNDIAEKSIEIIPEISEMEKNSEDISKAVSDRVSAPRRRRHIIFDVTDEDSVQNEDAVSDRFESFDEPADDIADKEQHIQSSDSVTASDDDIDELFAASHHDETKKEGGFFRKAFESFKKKRDAFKNRKNRD